MSDRRDRDYLEHILRAVEAIMRSSAGGRERFLADENAFDQLPALVRFAGSELGRCSLDSDTK